MSNLVRNLPIGIATERIHQETGIDSSTSYKWYLKKDYFKQFYADQVSLRNKKKRKTYAKKILLKTRSGAFPQSEKKLAAEILGQTPAAEFAPEKVGPFQGTVRPAEGKTWAMVTSEADLDISFKAK